MDLWNKMLNLKYSSLDLNGKRLSVQLTQDSAEVECSACTFTYRTSRTPTVTNATKAPTDPGPGYTVTITGTNLCP